MEKVRYWGILEFSYGLTEDGKSIQKLLGPYKTEAERDAECNRLNKTQEGIKQCLRKAYYRANCIDPAEDANEQIKDAA